MIKKIVSMIGRGTILLGLCLFGSVGKTDQPMPKPTPRTVLDRPEPQQIAVVGSSHSLTETGLARQRQRAQIQARSEYADGHSLVTATEIRDFLSRQNSPMAAHAEEIVLAGNRYGIDPRMIVAIAGVESQYGKRCRGFNAWGWNGGRTRWSSWTESIHMYSASMRSSYPNWRNLQRVAPRYNPNTPEAWGRKVAFLMGSIQAAA